MDNRWLDELARTSTVEPVSRRKILGRLTVGLVGAGFGALTVGAGGASARGAQCPPGLRACGGVCVVTSIDPDNCGACGNVCGPDEVCRGGACVQVGACVTQRSCNGVCTDTLIDSNNCGACGNVCPESEFCCSGVCTPRGSQSGFPIGDMSACFFPAGVSM